MLPGGGSWFFAETGTAGGEGRIFRSAWTVVLWVLAFDFVATKALSADELVVVKVVKEAELVVVEQ